jgi:hypothetical protein
MSTQVAAPMLSPAAPGYAPLVQATQRVESGIGAGGGVGRVRRLHLFSGGIVSWASAKRDVQKHGTEGVALLFADTMMEDEDLYRFIVEAAANVGVPLTRIADGRTPWEVMRDHHSFATNRMDFCSEELKRDLLDKWFADNCSAETVSCVGLDWTEMHRLDRMRQIMPERQWEAPMTEKPYMTKAQMMDWLKAEGIEPPRLYKLGFPHNNCGGFCIKAGQAHFALLLRTMPERYAYHEAKERELRETVGDYGILRDRTGGTTKTLTLEAFRKRIESQADLFDAHDWGGCGCALPSLAGRAAGAGVGLETSAAEKGHNDSNSATE